MPHESEATPLEGEGDALLEVLVDHARRGVVRLEDRVQVRRREILDQAEEHVRALESAVDDIGRTRGEAAETSLDLEAEAEIRGVLEGAFDRLEERFVRRVGLALEALPSTPDYAPALRAWAKAAVKVFSGPAEVFAAPRDGEALYDALLEAGAHDFRVVADRSITCGFVARDLDGRTLIDRRPDALLEEHAASLSALLERVVPTPPGLEPSSSLATQEEGAKPA